MENLHPEAQKLFNEGLAAYHSGRFYEAVERYRQCVNILVANSPGSKTAIARTYWNLGDAYLDNNQPHDAIWAYNKSLDTEITKEIAGVQFFTIAGAQAKSGLFRDAVRNLKKCLQYPMPMDGPPRSDVLMNLGISLTEVFDSDGDKSCIVEAVQVLEQAVRLYPNDPGLREQERISRLKLQSIQKPVEPSKPISQTTVKVQNKVSSKVPTTSSNKPSLSKSGVVTKDGNTQPGKFLYVLVGILIVTTCVFLFIFKPASQAPQKVGQKITIGLVSSQSANIRSGPSQNHSIIAKAKLGDTLIVISNTNDWLFVKHNNAEGYIHDKLVKQQILTK